MSYFREILQRFLSLLRGEQLLLQIFAAICCMALVAWSVVFAMRLTRPRRTHGRRLVGKPVLVSWSDPAGPKQSDDGFCQDISTGGMALELPFPLKVHTRLSFRMSEDNLSGSGVVYRCKPLGERYAVGVKFDPLMRSIVSLQLQKS